MILAHIASKRTDDPKIGVGAVLVYADGTYGSVGWNGYPKKVRISELSFKFVFSFFRLIF